MGKKLKFQLEGNRIVLHGRVYSYFQKQMAQEAVRRVLGEPRIDNQLEVLWPEDRPASQTLSETFST